MSNFDYQAYLASREWALKREAVRKRCGGVCERCKKSPFRATHHKTYARIGNELLEDLLGVCEECHKYLSGKSDIDPCLEPKIQKRIPAFDYGSNGIMAIKGRCPLDKDATCISGSGESVCGYFNGLYDNPDKTSIYIVICDK